jgi:hypothetical protein
MHRVVELRLDRGGQFAKRLPSPVEPWQRNGRTGSIRDMDAFEVGYAGENITPRTDVPGERLGRKESAVWRVGWRET